jgi:exosortase/archaeosortase family protein
MVAASSARSGSRWRIGQFVGKVLAFYALWYVLYDLWLLPDGTVDQWLSLNVASVSGTLLGGLGFEAIVDGRSLALRGIPGVYIANGCNGLSTLGLFVGFVLAYPGSTQRRLWFIPFGVFVVYLTNVLRVVVMVLSQKYWPAAFEPLHGFGLTTIFYVVVFALWVLWANYGESAGTAPAGGAPTDAPDHPAAVSPSG